MLHYAFNISNRRPNECKNCGCHIVSHGRNNFGRKFLHTSKTNYGNIVEKKICKLHNCSTPELEREKIKV
jgi:hypothetical protein